MVLGYWLCCSGGCDVNMVLMVMVVMAVLRVAYILYLSICMLGCGIVWVVVMV